MMARPAEFLAGRIALFELLPFSFEELREKPMQNAKDYYDNYLSTYVERDVRQIINIKNVSSFQILIQVLPARAGNLLNTQDKARDCGISHATTKN
ncbi:MAG: hypothetical protein LE168_02615 [Endomicrobium sp.]|nr:hypothetical protein [Endomicrobium sp.]